MFPVKADYIRRVSFATRIFPKIKSALGVELNKLKTSDRYDGDLFCGGRSKNRDLLTFFGFLNDSSYSSTFVQLPTFRRSLKKLINLIERELEIVGAQEVLMPTLVSQKLWHQSNRLDRQQDALNSVFRLTDKNGTELLLGPTFEETITKMMAEMESINETELPILLYQTSSKFRNEPCPKFGLLRSKEFLMNDLYSFDKNLESATRTYETISNVYKKIFDRLQLNCLSIESETGNIGGKYSHEYQLPIASGEDTIIKCNTCQHAYNFEMQPKSEGEDGHSSNSCLNCKGTNVDRFKALELGHTFLLSDIYSKPFKAKYTSEDGLKRINFEMGCYGLGMTRILGACVDLLSIIPESGCNVVDGGEKLIQLRWPNDIEPYKIGLIVPAKRSKQYKSGSSEFVEKLVNRILDTTRSVDLIVEDRDKEGIGRRLFRLQSMGIPNIIVIGQKFLNDPPELELLKLDSKKQSYEQSWFSEDQLCEYVRTSLDK